MPNFKSLVGQTFGNLIAIERVKIGYEIENCVSCCYECNLLKSDRSLKKFLKLIKNIAIYKLNMV